MTIVDGARGLEYDSPSAKNAAAGQRRRSLLRLGAALHLDGSGLAEVGDATAAHFSDLAGPGPNRAV